MQHLQQEGTDLSEDRRRLVGPDFQRTCQEWRNSEWAQKCCHNDVQCRSVSEFIAVCRCRLKTLKSVQSQRVCSSSFALLVILLSPDHRLCRFQSLILNQEINNVIKKTKCCMRNGDRCPLICLAVVQCVCVFFKFLSLVGYLTRCLYCGSSQLGFGQLKALGAMETLLRIKEDHYYGE